MYPGGPHSVLLSFSPPFSLLLLNPEGNRSGTRKEIKFWIERLIINSAGKPSFRGTQFHIYLFKNQVNVLKTICISQILLKPRENNCHYCYCSVFLLINIFNFFRLLHCPGKFTYSLPYLSCSIENLP